ncbi:MAG: WYL domain-containing protein [Candidatus Planktophila sp.]|nr:WYL domain-containing protein [Candidatus Planktophila sp.]
MTKKFSAPLERTARLLDLVPYISAHQGISLKQLAETFNVSQSQMVNDLTTLWMCGLPGYTPLELMDLDFESGYVTINNAETLSKPRSITFDEGVALVLGLDLIRSTIDEQRADLLQSIDSLSDRLRSLINMPASLHASSPVNHEVSSSLNEAIRVQSGLKIVYHSLYRDEITTREILPIEIIENEGQSYLSSYCYTALDFRLFRVDRIQSATLIKVSKTFPSQAANDSIITSTIKVIEPNRDFSERFKLNQMSKDMEFQFNSYSQQWLERSILASGKGAALIAPLHIRQSIAELAQSMLDRYKPS